MSQVYLHFFVGGRKVIFIVNDGLGSDGKIMERLFDLGIAIVFLMYFCIFLELYEWIHYRHFCRRFYQNYPTKIWWVLVSKTKNHQNECSIFSLHIVGSHKKAIQSEDTGQSEKMFRQKSIQSPFKGYLRYKAITLQNVPSEAQIIFFFISQKNYVPLLSYSSLCIFNHPMIYQICDVTMSIST